VTAVTTEFWAENQPGFKFTDKPIGTPEFFADVAKHRYETEPHIPAIVRFGNWRNKDVLEVGCGIATDGTRFADAGARYTGVDATESAVQLARHRFEQAGLPGEFGVADATGLPFPDNSFDLVYSHGVMHHIPDTQAAIQESHRVLRPGGTLLVMVYHHNSLNYRVTIMVVRRLLAAMLLLPNAAKIVAKLTGENPAVLEGHHQLLRRHGLRYLTDRGLFLSNNTDGPGNPLSKVYSRKSLNQLLAGFGDTRFNVRYLNLRIYPGGRRFERSPMGRRLERRFGWHLYVEARKG
jgi:ubiquinone/menaquinone biosynthesis C-methylase UbiE